MPSSTVREESEYRLPAGVPFPAILAAVEVKTIKYKKDGVEKSFDKWEWDFEITEGEYAGMHAYGETQDFISTHPDNLVRQWSEILRDAPFEVGDGIDTDELLGLPCVITVRHEEPRPKTSGGNFYGCPVDQVYPEGTGVTTFNNQGGDEPPF